MTSITLYKKEFPVQFKYEGRTLEGIIFKRNSGKRIYFTGIMNGMRMCEIAKIMSFKDGKVFISFGKDKLEIGEYTS